MRARWETEVERPWVGMTNESMTDVEQARANLMIAREKIPKKLNVPSRIRAAIRRRRTTDATVTKRRVGVAITAIGAGTTGAGILVTLRLVRPRQRRRDG